MTAEHFKNMKNDRENQIIYKYYYLEIGTVDF